MKQQRQCQHAKVEQLWQNGRCQIRRGPNTEQWHVQPGEQGRRGVQERQAERVGQVQQEGGAEVGEKQEEPEG